MKYPGLGPQHAGQWDDLVALGRQGNVVAGGPFGCGREPRGGSISY